METAGFPLIKVAQTEQGTSVSCVLEEVQRVVMAKPVILSDEVRPTNFTLANQVGVQTDERVSSDVPLDELGRTIQSHLWLANLEMSSGTTPTMSSTSNLPQQPHPDGPTLMTWNQLRHEQNALVDAHRLVMYLVC